MTARDTDIAMRETVGQMTPDEYDAALPEWNRAIATLHGVHFDVSHDRELGQAPSG